MMDVLLSPTEIVKKYSISYQTLNYYTNLGLLSVADKRGNKRMYDEKELIINLKQIQKLKKEGYPLRLIRKILYKQ